MKKGYLRSLRTLLICCPGLVVAQNASDCAQFESHGIYNTVDIQTTASQFQQTQSFFQSHTFHSRKEAQDQGAKLGIPLGDILGLNFGGYDSSSSYEEWQSAFLASNSSLASSNQKLSIATRTISDAMVSLIGTCLKIPGLHTYLHRLPDDRFFAVEANYVAVGPPYETQVNFVISPKTARSDCQPSDMLSKPVTIGSGGKTLQCTRDPKESVLITVNSTNGTKTLFLPRVTQSPAVKAVSREPTGKLKNITYWSYPFDQAKEGVSFMWETANAYNVRVFCTAKTGSNYNPEWDILLNDIRPLSTDASGAHHILFKDLSKGTWIISLLFDNNDGRPGRSTITSGAFEEFTINGHEDLHSVP